MENIGLRPECNAIIDEVKTRHQTTSWSSFRTRSQILRRESRRRSRAVDSGGTASFLVRTDMTTLLFIDFSLGSPLGSVNSLLVVGVRGEFVRQIFVNGRLSKFALVN